ncbi:unnamed protein product [Effrenium voratum]|nr:unnamed protein product [Effrenium voratum]
MAEARRRHQKSVRQAVVQATQEDTPAEIVDMPAQSLLEGRIQEAVSAACTGKREKKPLGPKKRARRQVDKAMRQYVESTPLHMDMEAGEGSKWIVVGGQGTSGIIVRTGVSLKSQALHVRLTFGCWLEELSLEGNRLHFRRLRGDGPDFGWVSVELDGHRPLVRPLSAEEARALPAFRAPVMVR